MRSYFKVFYIGGTFHENQEGLPMRTPDQGGSDQIFAVTFFGGGFAPDRKRNFVEYLNQIVPLAATEAGAIAVSQLGFEDYATYHALHPDG